MATEITEGSAYFNIGANTENLHKGTNEVVSDFQKMSAEADKAGKKMDQSFNPKAADNFKNVLAQVNGTVAENERYLSGLQKAYKDNAASIELAGKATDQQLIKQGRLKAEIEGVTKILSLQRKEWGYAAGSADQLKLKLDQLAIAQNRLSAADRQGSLGSAIKAEIATTSAALDKAKSEMDAAGKSATGMGSTIAKGASAGWGALRKLAYIIPGLGIAGIIGIIVDGIVSLIQSSGLFRKELTELEKAQQNIKAVNDASIDGYIKQKVTMEDLTDRVKKGGLSFREKEDILKTYNKEFGDSIGRAKKYSEAEDYIIKRGPVFIEALRDRANELAAMGLAVEAAKKSIELSQKAPEEFVNGLDKLVLKADKAAQIFKTQTGFKWIAEGSQEEADRIIQQGKIAQYKQVKAEDEKQAAMLKIQDDYRQKREAKEAEAKKKGFSIKYGDEESVKKAKDLTAQIKQQADLLNEISKSKGKYDIQFGSGLEKEQDKINTYFNDLAKKVDEFNKTHKVKLTPEQITKAKSDIESSRSYALGLADDKEAGNILIKQLAEQKKIYKDYEDFKTQYGEKAANDLYGNLAKKYKTYLDRVQAEYNRLDEKGKNGLNPAEANLFSTLTTLLAEANKDSQYTQANIIKTRVAEEEKAYQEIIKKAKDYYLQVQKLEKDHQAAIAALKRKNLPKQEYDAQLKAIDDFYNKALKKIDTENSDFYQALNLKIQDASKEQIQTAIKIIEDVIYSGKFKNNRTGEMLDIPPDVILRLKDYRNQLRLVLQDASDLGKVVRTLKDVGNALSAIGGNISQVDGGSGLGDMLTTVGESLKDISNVIDNFQDAIKQLKGAFKSGSWKGDWSSLVGIIISAITFIVRLFGNVKRYKEQLDQMQKSLESETANYELGEYLVNEQLRQQNLLKAEAIDLTLKELAAKKQVLETSRQQSQSEADNLLKLLQGEQYITDKWIKGRTWLAQVFGGKAKEKTDYASLAGMNYDQINKLFLEGRLEGRALTLFQQLQKLKQEGADIDKQLIELNQQANEILTATTADSITDSIIQGFRDGKHSLEDFASSFEDLMREAMLNSLKYKYLEGPIQDFYKQFADDAQSDGALTKDEIAQLRLSYKTIWDTANKQFDDLKSVTGLNFNNSGSSNTIQGQIKNITQDQADALTGQFMGQRVATLELVDINKRMADYAYNNLNYVQKIEANTYNTVLRLDAAVTELKTLNNKISDTSNQQRLVG